MRPWVAMLLLALAASAPVLSAPQAQDFDTPDAAVAALVDAVRAHQGGRLRSILGRAGGKLVRSGDPAEDACRQQKFVAAYDAGHRIVHPADDQRRAELQIGSADWPLPIPLVQAENGRWHFDTASAAKEILARRIGRNELSAMQVCLAIVDAEREYAQGKQPPEGLGEYTPHFRSHPGLRDGLYWPSAANEAPSPLGPLLAKAAQEGVDPARPGRKTPYQGYFYKILTAPGGAYDYRVKGKLIGGIAVLAWPARYGASGVMSFMVSQNRVVYESNLGRHTEALARVTQRFNPDAAWREAQPQADNAQDSGAGSSP